MSKGEVSTVHVTPAAAASSQYLHWLQRERRTRLIIRAAQVAILIAFLVLPDYQGSWGRGGGVVAVLVGVGFIMAAWRGVDDQVPAR